MAEGRSFPCTDVPELVRRVMASMGGCIIRRVAKPEGCAVGLPRADEPGVAEVGD